MKNLIFIIGPPSVGKMTVGQELVKKKGYVLFHNHHSIELTLDLFKHGTKEFHLVNDGIRDLVFDTVAKSENVEGFIFTFVLAFNVKKDIEIINKYREIFEKENWKTHVLELSSDLETRRKRNDTPNRLEHKKSKRDLEFSSNNINKMEEQYEMNSNENVFENVEYLRVDNTNKSAEEVAGIMIKEFKF